VKIIYEEKGKKIIDNGDTITKIIIETRNPKTGSYRIAHIDDNWFKCYQEIYERYRFTPRLYSFKSDTFVMEKIKGVPIGTLHKNEYKRDYYKIISKLFKILSSLYEYNINNSDRWFWHCDTVSKNFMWDGNNLTLIDPEAWCWIDLDLLTKLDLPDKILSSAYSFENLKHTQKWTF